MRKIGYICDKITDDNSLRENCYFQVAGEKSDTKPYKEMENIGLQSMCYIDVAKKTGDANFCEKIIS